MGRKLVGTSALILILILISANSASALNTWVEFTNPQISFLNDNVYRFRVDVNWGGDIYIDPETNLAVDPILDRLWISNILGTPVNWTGNHSGAYGYSYAGDWYGGIESPYLRGEFGLHGPEFGWDFIPDAPLQSSYTLGYTAFMAWLDYDYVYMNQIEGGQAQPAGEVVLGEGGRVDHPEALLVAHRVDEEGGHLDQTPAQRLAEEVVVARDPVLLRGETERRRPRNRFNLW